MTPKAEATGSNPVGCATAPFASERAPRSTRTSTAGGASRRPMTRLCRGASVQSAGYTSDTPAGCAAGVIFAGSTSATAIR